ncbi:unextended protein-like [Periplaneta americana]|uniref:unextended protein-like n=1 Tax=Periplaneta americana TaxID=6978 RepID=UPI0037E93E12
METNLNDQGIPQLPLDSSITFRIFGSGLIVGMEVTYTEQEEKSGEICEYPNKREAEISSVSDHSAVVEIRTPSYTDKRIHTFYLCLKDATTNSWLHQGSDHWLTFQTYALLLPLWALIIIMCISMLLSSLVSGLTLGLLALDVNELRVLSRIGTADEKRYVDAILPIRKNGNQLLCTLVLANVLCNSTYTVILDSLTNGLVAIVLATCSIVVLAEILPQAVCTHYGLLIGAKTIYITRFFMILMFPLAYPIGHLLTWLLGGDVGVVYTRDHFMAMLKVAVENGEQVSPNEVNIISGAFDMKTKTVGEIMTPIDKVYMLNYDDVLDFDTVMEIVKEGNVLASTTYKFLISLLVQQ